MPGHSLPRPLRPPLSRARTRVSSSPSQVPLPCGSGRVDERTTPDDERASRHRIAGRLVWTTDESQGLACAFRSRIPMKGPERERAFSAVHAEAPQGDEPNFIAAPVAARRAWQPSPKRVAVDSAPVYGTEGHRFESCRARFEPPGSRVVCALARGDSESIQQYFERVAGESLALGEEPVRYYDLAQADAAAPPEVFPPGLAAPGMQTFSAPLLPMAPAASDDREAHTLVRTLFEDIAIGWLTSASEHDRLRVLAELDRHRAGMPRCARSVGALARAARPSARCGARETRAAGGRAGDLHPRPRP
jgi:hypothetical protein